MLSKSYRAAAVSRDTMHPKTFTSSPSDAWLTAGSSMMHREAARPHIRVTDLTTGLRPMHGGQGLPRHRGG